MPGSKILIVEDEGIEALDLQQRLTSQGYDAVDIASTGEEAIQKAKEFSPDLVLMDIMLQGEIDGITAAGQIRADLDIPIIYITAYADEKTLQRAKLTEPHGYIVKPFRERELIITINMALYKHIMEKKLKDSQKWLSTTLNSIGDGVITTDQKGLITLINPVAEETMGWKLEEVKGKKLTEVFNIINMFTRKPTENPVSRVLADGCIVGLANHTLLISRDGKEIPIDDSAAPIKDDKGNVLGVVLVFRDVTERMESEKALRESNKRYREMAEKLREADANKNEFMAVLSHELRNPLASIHMSLCVLKRVDPGSQQAKKAIDIIERQTEQLSHLVDDLLDITRINQNKIKLELQRVELNEILRNTVEDHRPLFEKNGVCLESTFAPFPLYLEADQARIVQVVGNLLHNAAKFTNSGGSTRVSLEADTANGQAVIRVADTGIGIAPDVLKNLFRPFMQASLALNRNQRGGLGLGLALSKGLIELHGGSITANSDGPGKGTEFIIKLPLKEVPVERPRTSYKKASSQSRKVLIIDDNEDMAECLRELLEFCGHKVVVAFNGTEGIEKARKFRPEFVLCDIGLPYLDGYEVARIFREDELLKDSYLAAVSGYTLPEDLERSSRAGFDCHLSKPVDLDKLNKILSEIPNQQTSVENTDAVSEV